MELNILDRSYTLLAVIDQFESLAWSVRYNEPGEFELKAIVDVDSNGLSELLGYLSKQNYCSIKESDRIMIIESVNYVSDYETGDTVTAKGRSLESILDRRVIAYKMVLDGSLQDEIMRLLNTTVIEPEDENRQIKGFRMKKSEDPAITKLTVKLEVLGETVLDIIVGLCQAHNLGFRVLPDYETSGFIFELYKGVDRSYNQESLPPVVFSPKYENLINSNYVDSDENLKNFVYVIHEDREVKIEVYPGQDNETPSDPPKDLNRRELYISSSVSIPEPESYGPDTSGVDYSDGENGTWEWEYDVEAYEAAREARRIRAENRVKEAGGEANMSWPPPGREGQSYVDWEVGKIDQRDYKKEWFVPGGGYSSAVSSAGASQTAAYNNAAGNVNADAAEKMKEEGQEALIEHQVSRSFDGEVVNYFQFVAEVDYQLGDVVQIINNLFVNIPTRLVELTFMEDSSGLSVVPSFMTDIDIDVEEEL